MLGQVPTHAEPVGPVKEGWIFHFLVLAAAIEAHGFAEQDVMFESFLRWRRHQCFGPTYGRIQVSLISRSDVIRLRSFRYSPVPLIKEEGVEVRLAVESQGAVTSPPID